jgi:hypothetical protein
LGGTAALATIPVAVKVAVTALAVTGIAGLGIVVATRNDPVSAGSSSSTTIEVVRPEPPDTTVSLTGNDAVLNWASPIQNDSEAVVEIQRDGKVVATLQALAGKFEDRNLPANSVHTYQVRIGRANLLSDWSDPVTITTPPPRRSTPTADAAARHQPAKCSRWAHRTLRR